jgi:hypothetical protein
MFTESSSKSHYQRTRAKTQLQTVSVNETDAPSFSNHSEFKIHTLRKINMSVIMDVW